MLKVTALKKSDHGTSPEMLEQLFLYLVLHFYTVFFDKSFRMQTSTIFSVGNTAQRLYQNKTRRFVFASSESDLLSDVFNTISTSKVNQIKDIHRPYFCSLKLDSN